MNRFTRPATWLGGLTLMLTLVGQAAPAGAQVAGFADPAFQRTWERTDKPVADAKANRSWFWGPSPGFSIQEPYKQGAGGTRLVQYFDKTRMEINNPGGNQNDPFYVTNGLLAVELMTGRMQTGDADFEQHCPANIPLASDGDDPTAPTYATFGQLLTQTKANRVGQPNIATVDRNGTIGSDPGKAGDANAANAFFESRTERNIPKIFWDFLNASGPIYQNGAYTTGPLSQPWFVASGLPLTEAYWARVKVGGAMLDVLVQAYERRILTYIPAYNGSPFNVQMGNVGQHYYNWRYKGAGCTGGPVPTTPTPGGGGGGPVPTPTTAPISCADVPPSRSATVTPACGRIGTIFRIHITGFTPGEKISLWLTDPDGDVFGTEAPLNAGNHPGSLDDEFDSSIIPFEGLWAITYQGEQSAHQSTVYFKILPATPPTATPVGATPPPAPPCDLNGAIDATVSPPSGPKGTVFSVSVFGFRGGEEASFWLTDPDGAVFGAPETLTIPSSGGGTLQIRSSVLYPGRWALTIHGLSSGHESVGVFCVGP
ncbi:MAG TPA: hypothetical protein VM536_11375 [Chloroflexia bacterium]|nr:hypothetical protein [Chloroflexia bacterium]